MKSLTDTIVACSTSLDTTAISIVRLTGEDSYDVVSSLVVGRNFDRKHCQMSFIKVSLVDDIQDEAMVCYYGSPRSYTGEDMVEVFLHGNPIIVQLFIDACIQKGCRIAERGEFTKRAFLNGKKDLLQAESVRAMIDAPSLRALKLSSDQLSGKISSLADKLREKVYDVLLYIESELDFVDQEIDFLSQEDYRNRFQKIDDLYTQLYEHFKQMAIHYHQPSFTLCGLPNVGKSSLFNCFLDQDLAIVTSIEGTTRDVLSSTLLIEGKKISLHDTAGLRQSNDLVEKEGIKRAVKTVELSDVILYIVDGPAFLLAENYREKVFENIQEVSSFIQEDAQIIFIVNKSEEIQAEKKAVIQEKLQVVDSIFFVSSLKRETLMPVREYLASFMLSCDRIVDRGDVWSVQRTFLASMKEEIDLLAQCDILRQREILPLYLRSFLKKIDSFCHRDFKEDILDEIFNRFCIGK